jgi:hypothetical protein
MVPRLFRYADDLVPASARRLAAAFAQPVRHAAIRQTRLSKHAAIQPQQFRQERISHVHCPMRLARLASIATHGMKLVDRSPPKSSRALAKASCHLQKTVDCTCEPDLPDPVSRRARRTPLRAWALSLPSNPGRAAPPKATPPRAVSRPNPPGESCLCPGTRFG